MYRGEIDRVEQVEASMRRALSAEEKYRKYTYSVEVEQGAAAMLIGENPKGVAFRKIMTDCPYRRVGRRKMYFLTDIARTVVREEVGW
jgi:hypothetical protein